MPTLNGRSRLRALPIALLVAIGGCGGATKDASRASAASPLQSGETTYNRFCFSCHAAGVAGAPRVGDVAAWAPRIAKGDAALLRSATNGVPPGMPAKGMCLQCSDAELRAAIEYMVGRSR